MWFAWHTLFGFVPHHAQLNTHPLPFLEYPLLIPFSQGLILPPLRNAQLPLAITPSAGKHTSSFSLGLRGWTLMLLFSNWYMGTFNIYRDPVDQRIEGSQGHMDEPRDAALFSGMRQAAKEKYCLLPCAGKTGQNSSHLQLLSFSLFHTCTCSAWS